MATIAFGINELPTHGTETPAGSSIDANGHSVHLQLKYT